MHRLNALISIAAGIALVLAAGGPPVTAQRGPERGAAIDALLRRAVQRGDVPGVVAMATDRDGIIYQGPSARRVAAGRPMTADAIFRIASMTKAVTSVAAMQLVEQAARSRRSRREIPARARSISSVFESFDAATGAYTVRPAPTTVTVRHLFTHTSGLGYPFTSADPARLQAARGRDAIAAGPLLFEPGTRLDLWDEHRLGRTAGREAVSGKSLDDYFRERIFDAARHVRHRSSTSPRQNRRAW